MAVREVSVPTKSSKVQSFTEDDIWMTAMEVSEMLTVPKFKSP